MLFQRLTFNRKNRNVSGCNRGGRMVLGGKDIARRPAHIRAQRDQCFDQHSCLDRHMERSNNTRARQRFFLAIFRAQGHQPGHFGFGNVELFAPKLCQRDIFDDVVLRHRL